MIDAAPLFPYILAAYSVALLLCTSFALRVWLRFRTAKKQWQEWQQLTSNAAYLNQSE